MPAANVDPGAVIVVFGLCATRGTQRNSWKNGDAHTEKEVRRALRGYAAKLTENGGNASEHVIVMDIDGRGGGEGSDMPEFYNLSRRCSRCALATVHERRSVLIALALF